MSKNTMDEKNIYEIHSKYTFLKVKPVFTCNKILFAFVETENDKKTLKNSINCYMSVPDAALLAAKITSGRMYKMITGEKGKGEKYPQEVWRSPLGGINEGLARERGLRKDGKAISRFFSLAPGSVQYVVLTARQCAGRSDEQGLIIPENNDPEKVIIRVPFANHDELEKMGLMLQAAVNAYMSVIMQLKAAEQGIGTQQVMDDTQSKADEDSKTAKPHVVPDIPPIIWPDNWATKAI